MLGALCVDKMNWLEMRILGIIGVCVGIMGALSVAMTHGWAADPLTHVPTSTTQIQLSFAPVVKQAAPAVVNIYTKKVVVTRGVSPLMADPFFRHFFGDGLFGGGGLREKVQSSLGSGVILQSDGVVVTNNHVIKGASHITVVLSDRREFEAELVGADERTDLAVLRLKEVGETLPTLDLADSDTALEVGDLVIAIGNPFGVGQTVTTGIVSAMARTNVGISDFRSFIQTDAAINPGNSGGALVALDGRLVGVNTAIYSRDGGNVGLGFAIPSNMVRTTVESILKTGKAVRPWLGASGQPVAREIAASLGLDRPGGVLVNRVTEDSPADDAGIQVGDVVVAVNGHPVLDVHALRYRIASLGMGGQAALTILRNGKTLETDLELVPPPEDPPRQETKLSGRKNPLSGASIAHLNPALAEEMGGEYIPGRVVVTKVGRSGYAARLGVQVGDMLQAINKKPMTTVKQVVAATGTPAVGGWEITIVRGGRIMNFRIR